MRELASEKRRLKRIQERNADTICFACREKGHAARDCPSTNKTALEDEADNNKNESHSNTMLGKNATGFCYR